MIYQDQTIALFLSTVADPARAGLAGSGLAPAGRRIQSLAIAALDVLHGGESEVRLRFLTADDDRSERDLLRTLGIEATGATIVCVDPVAVRSALRLRTALLLDCQPGGAETLHREISCATWVRAVSGLDASTLEDIADDREQHCAMAALLLLGELASRRVTPFADAMFERTAKLLKASAAETALRALADHVPGMRAAALGQ